MDYINQVEIKGRVSTIRLTPFADTVKATMSVCTQEHFFSKEPKFNLVQTSWHQITAWPCKEISRKTLESLKSGDTIHLQGKLKSVPYHDDNDDRDKTFIEILATKIFS